MATFRKGAEAIQAAATRSGGGKFTPTHRFEAGETKYLQFLTSIEDVYTILMHRFIIVGSKENGDPRYADFISRRDPSLDGSEGYDPLIDRFGSNPTQRCIGLAVELEPQYKKQGAKNVLDGFDIATRQYTDSEGEEKEVPNIALVVESPFTFFGHLTAFADIKPIEDVVFAVKRTGKSTDTQYTFIQAGDALDDIDGLVDEFLEEFDLEGYLDELADEDRIHELIDPLPDDFVVNKFAKKPKGKKEAASETETKPKSTRTRRVKEEEPEEEPEVEEEEAGEETTAATPARSRKFQQLRRETTGK